MGSMYIKKKMLISWKGNNLVHKHLELFKEMVRFNFNDTLKNTYY